MYTSAQALNELLTNIGAINKPKSRFLDVAAEYLGFAGDDPAGDAAFRIRKLVIRVQNDLEAVELDNVSKDQFKSRLNAFIPLANFSQMHQSMGDAKTTFLKPENLIGLTLVHGALNGNVNRFDLSFDLKDFSDEIAKLKTDIADLDIPDDLALVLFKRISQIQAAIDHYTVFGLTGLAEAISDLVGSIVIHVDSDAEQRNDDWFSSVKRVCGGLLGQLSKAREASENARVISENVPALAESGRKLLGYLINTNGGV